jgi:hypothetical protein
MSRPHYLDALDRVGVLSALSRFDPHVAGTPPLGLDLADSDIDVLCHAPDTVQFVCAIWAAFWRVSRFPGLAMGCRLTSGHRAIHRRGLGV